MPKSYLSNEPAIMRAILTKFDPYRQVKTRLKALATNGHKTDKVELITLGGSWSAYPRQYQTWFIKRCFDGLNDHRAQNLAQAQKLNESAVHRCIGLTLETRPDLITVEEIKRMRQLGCTRVELGVQTIFEPILKLNKRGHTVKQIANATKLLKKAGFKITYHLMPNLPGSTPAKDLKIFKELFHNPDFQPDQLKIYPCVVTKNSELYRWHRQGRFKPYSDNQLEKLLIEIKKAVPRYVRIIRLIRDIPSGSIIAGNKITNLRQIIQQKTVRTKMACHCIRCRQATKAPKNSGSVKLFIKKYRASDGVEYFLSLEDKSQKTLYAFLRLRIQKTLEPIQNDDLLKFNKTFPELKNAAIIRELHTYGELISIGSKHEAVQHIGLGKKLMTEAEKICKKNELKKIAVIAGIGVRKYYEKLGYRLENTYMIKNF